MDFEYGQVCSRVAEYRVLRARDQQEQLSFFHTAVFVHIEMVIEQIDRGQDRWQPMLVVFHWGREVN